MKAVIFAIAVALSVPPWAECRAQSTNCGAPTHVIASTEACSKIFNVSGTCNSDPYGLGPGLMWMKGPWENVGITLAEIDYDVMIQGASNLTYYAAAMVGNSWTPDPMTPYRQFVQYPVNGNWGALLVTDRARSYGAQFPAAGTPNNPHLDFYLACYASDANGQKVYPAFVGTIRVVYFLNQNPPAAVAKTE